MDNKNTISVIIRSYNDQKFIRKTMEMIIAQNIPKGFSLEIVSVDNESDDGTWEIITEINKTGVKYQIPRGSYIPGAVLNDAVKKASGSILVFNNSDCVPQNEQWLERLVAPLVSENETAAVFGNQIPRADAYPVVKKDNERAFGSGTVSASWKHFFSMATSATTRTIAEQHPFNPTMRYSEDIEWSWRLKQKGYTIRYVPDAIVEHSHNYSFSQLYRRFYGEGMADAIIFKEQKTFFRHFLMAAVAEYIRDVGWLFKRGHPVHVAYALPYRLIQKWGAYRGCVDYFSGKRW